MEELPGRSARQGVRYRLSNRGRYLLDSQSAGSGGSRPPIHRKARQEPSLARSFSGREPVCLSHQRQREAPSDPRITRRRGSTLASEYAKRYAAGENTEKITDEARHSNGSFNSGFGRGGSERHNSDSSILPRRSWHPSPVPHSQRPDVS
jgi:hypothetical protein